MRENNAPALSVNTSTPGKVNVLVLTTSESYVSTMVTETSLPASITWSSTKSGSATAALTLSSILRTVSWKLSKRVLRSVSTVQCDSTSLIARIAVFTASTCDCQASTLSFNETSTWGAVL